MIFRDLLANVETFFLLRTGSGLENLGFEKFVAAME